MKEIDWSKVKHFKPHEFECKCGCSVVAMDFDFIHMLDELRERHGRPLTVTSGYRCPTYNAMKSSTGRFGPHTTGKAVDLKVVGHDAHSVMNLAFMLGATGIGVSQKGDWGSRFIHIDVLPIGDKRPWVWSY